MVTDKNRLPARFLAGQRGEWQNRRAEAMADRQKITPIGDAESIDLRRAGKVVGTAQISYHTE